MDEKLTEKLSVETMCYVIALKGHVTRVNNPKAYRKFLLVTICAYLRNPLSYFHLRLAWGAVAEYLFPGRAKKRLNKLIRKRCASPFANH